MLCIVLFLWLQGVFLQLQKVSLRATLGDLTGDWLCYAQRTYKVCAELRARTDAQLLQVNLPFSLLRQAVVCLRISVGPTKLCGLVTQTEF